MTEKIMTAGDAVRGIATTTTGDLSRCTTTERALVELLIVARYAIRAYDISDSGLDHAIDALRKAVR